MELSEDILIKVNDEIELLVEQFQDVPVSELVTRFDISSEAKNKLNALCKRLIAYTNLITLSQLDEDNQIVFKTVNLDKYGKLKESMSFPAFKYEELAEEKWESSSLREYFLQHVLAFTVFQGKGKDAFLKKIVLWKMPSDVLENGVKKVWEQTRHCILNGEVVKYIDDNGRYFTFFPASTDSPYMHVRPHAQNRNDTFDLPVADKLTGLVKYPKHCFWLNRAYILKIITREGPIA